MLSSEKEIAELVKAPQEQLSFHAIVTEVRTLTNEDLGNSLSNVILQVVQPQYTMGGMQLDDDPRKNEPEILHRALRGLLPSSYPDLQASIVALISETIMGEIANGSPRDDGNYHMVSWFKSKERHTDSS